MMPSSSRAVAVLLVLTVCIASLPKTTHCFDVEELLPGTFNTAKPRDCVFTHWYPWQSCTQTSSGIMQHKRTRSMSQPKNNGTACPESPELTEWANCSDIEIIADKFIAVLHSTGPAPREDPVWKPCLSHLNTYIDKTPCRIRYRLNKPWKFNVTHLQYLHSIGPALTEDIFLGYLKSLLPEEADHWYSIYCSKLLYRYQYTPVCVPSLNKRFNVTYQDNSKVPCREYKDTQGNTLMAGGQCGANSRGNRSAQSMDEKQRAKRHIPRMRYLDIVFLLDESGSIGRGRFEDTILGLAKTITRSLCGQRVVHSTHTRIGVASFDEDNHEQFNLNNVNMNDAAGLIEAIGEIRYNEDTAGRTCLASALRYCKEHMFHPNNGARIDDHTEQIIILITDGCANCETKDLEDAARYLYDANISLLTILIDTTQDCGDLIKTLENVASERCYKMVQLQTWGQAEELRRIFESKECKDEQEEDNEFLTNIQNSCY